MPSCCSMGFSEKLVIFTCILLIKRKMVVGIIYRPPNGNFKEFVTRLNEMVTDTISVNNSEIFLIGDFNVDYSKQDTSNKKLIKEFKSLTGLHQIIRQPTRYGTCNSLIDLVFLY